MTNENGYFTNPYFNGVFAHTGGGLGEHIRDTIMLDRQGRVGVWKQDNWMERSTNDVVWLYGPRAQEEE